METDHGRLELGQHVGRFIVKRRSCRSSGKRVWIDSEFSEVGSENGPPGDLLFWVGSRRYVTKEVHIIRLGGLRRDSRQLFAQPIHAEHGARERAEATGIANRYGQCAA